VGERLQTDFEFRLTLNAEERLEVALVRETLLDVVSLLRDIEKQLTRSAAEATWRWGNDPDLTLIASVNGVSSETLDQVVGIAAAGFRAAEAAAETRSQVAWPEAFGQEARTRATKILGRLRKLDSITVGASGRESFDIRKVYVGRTVRGKTPRRRVFSSVEGLLRMIAGGENVIKAGLREHGTGAYVSVTLDRETWHERVRDTWDQRVVIDGRVTYSPDGKPLSVVDVTDIRIRAKGRPLAEFEGATDDYVGMLRGDG
jgi:hypothetical protein